MPSKKKVHVIDFEVEDMAVDALIAMVGTVARHYGLCPTCLTYALADRVCDLEDSGVIGHGALAPEDQADMLAEYLKNVRPVGGEQ